MTVFAYGLNSSDLSTHAYNIFSDSLVMHFESNVQKVAIKGLANLYCTRLFFVLLYLNLQNSHLIKNTSVIVPQEEFKNNKFKMNEGYYEFHCYVKVY